MKTTNYILKNLDQINENELKQFHEEYVLLLEKNLKHPNSEMRDYFCKLYFETIIKIGEQIERRNTKST